MKTLYQILGVPKDAEPELITKMYRRLVKRYHPDRNTGDPEAAAKYAEVDEAYRVLNDPNLRAEYDRTGEPPPRRSAPADRETAEILGVLQPILVGVLHDADVLGGVKRCRIVDRMRDRLRDAIQSAERHREKVEKGVANLTYIMDRFRVPEGEQNLLADTVRSQLRGVEAELNRIKGELDKLTRAKAYLQKVSYASEGDDPSNLLRAIGAMSWTQIQ